MANQSLIGRYEHLKNRPKSDEALPLLEKIASQVKPIMIKRKWNVGTLGEFFPSDPSLLGINMNAGQRINLRLRPPGSPSDFYEFDQLVLVMLHELTHIQYGPHDASFYKLLAELEEEYYELKRKGYSGEGFNSSGNHLSGFKVDEYHGKLQGLAAAEKRLAVQKKIGKGSVLGGSSVLGRSMKDVLAEAAERRMRDDKICHTTSTQEVEAEVKKAEEESEGVDADQLGGHSAAPSSVTPPSGSASTLEDTSRPKQQTSSRPPNPSYTSTPSATTIPKSVSGPSARSVPKPKPTRKAIPSSQVIDLTEDNDHPPSLSTPTPTTSTEWECPTCTLLNPISQPSCEACTTPNPKPVRPPKQTGRGWYCDFCGSGPRDMGFWSCNECGWVRKWG